MKAEQDSIKLLKEDTARISTFPKADLLLDEGQYILKMAFLQKVYLKSHIPAEFSAYYIVPSIIAIIALFDCCTFI